MSQGKEGDKCGEWLRRDTRLSVSTAGMCGRPSPWPPSGLIASLSTGIALASLTPPVNPVQAGRTLRVVDNLNSLPLMLPAAVLVMVAYDPWDARTRVLSSVISVFPCSAVACFSGAG